LRALGSGARPGRSAATDEAAGLLNLPEGELTPGVRAALHHLSEESAGLRRELERTRSRLAELERLANEDSLTPISNRRAFLRDLARMIGYVERYGAACSLLYFDLNDLKAINDSFGHAAGAKALVEIAEVLREHFRYTDLLCRVGGEEFAVLLPGLNLQTAQPLAQRIVKAVAARPITNDAAIIEYSISCGIADTLTNRDLPTLFKAADDAMYLAKQRGRNRVALQDVAA
jgi:diguanylate cyclase (GGDEF)-like protein